MLAKKSVLHEPNSERDAAVNFLVCVTAKLDVPLFQTVNSEPVRRNVKGGVYGPTMDMCEFPKGKNYLKVKSVRIHYILF